MIPKFIYLAPLSKKIYKLTQIEKISDLPFCPVVPKITKKKKIIILSVRSQFKAQTQQVWGSGPRSPKQ